MEKFNKVLDFARETIEIELFSLRKLTEFLDQDFVKAVEVILHSKGRVILTGIGKSAIIAQKIVATMNSTGTPAIFMHAADAIHGDLGIIQKEDVVICISKSGNTPEIKVLVPLLKREGNPLIAITANKESFLGLQADYILCAYTHQEACPNNLAPTTSTTAQLVIGDALSVALMRMKQFGSEDFAKYHPGGALGKKLYLTVGDVIAKNEVPSVLPTTDIKQAIVEISQKMLGVTAVVEGDTAVGIITDGDIRRMLNKYEDIKGLMARDIMSLHPKTVEAHTLATDALDFMQNHKITQLLVTKAGKYVGVIHLHNLIQEGII
ncbi:KpsF/GutQ family sugar-phosphate isomerase [uncultured Capnocytophaga sp.]|uniref:KpsF/GutQ family sugar-phosphate isomerase n=1 Tax=uncultured Capnocytophaga sp. TaxID=159273 RepID=UPI0028F0130E|nr:KpsF/GutQ family sugar-phosphate isomerase [uncultured Capnocytophaga sp.]